MGGNLLGADAGLAVLLADEAHGVVERIGYWRRRLQCSRLFVSNAGGSGEACLVRRVAHGNGDESDDDDGDKDRAGGDLGNGNHFE